MSKPDFYLTLLNHWSYTGIGWSLGLESCAQSIADSLDMADYNPSVKVGINLDALTYELVAEHYPHLNRRLKKYLAEGRTEIVGGTFGQPMGSMVSGESNLRQLLVGQETITHVLGQPVAVFLEEEEMSHPQVPQLTKLAGYRYASMAQCDTWGRHGAPVMDDPVIWWEGADGTRMLSVPATPLVFHPPMVTADIDWLWTDEGKAALAKLSRDRTPLVLKWTEFGWEKLTGKSINKFDPELFRTLSDKFNVEYLTVEQYLDKQKEVTNVPVRRPVVDDFNKLLPWGIGGDQIRRFGREVESVLLAAERYEAIAHGLKLGVNDVPALREAWRQFLAAQSHDVSLCEYTRHQGAAPPDDPILDQHFQTWGSYGYRFMDEAVTAGRAVLKRALHAIAGAVDTKSGAAGELAAVVFNPCGFARPALVTTGVLQLEEFGVRALQVCDAAGKPVPTQVLSAERAPDGKLVCAELAFAADALPSVGYETFYLQSSPGAEATTDLHVDQAALVLENACVRVELDPVCGGVRRLVDKATGRALMDETARPFPTLTGEANTAAPLAHRKNETLPAYDTAKTQATFTWLETGPLRVRVRATHGEVNRLRFEITVTLTAGSPDVDVQARVFADLPPKTGEAKVNGWQFPLEITEGYWMELRPAFAVATVLRDYPFGVEPSVKPAFTALTWLDLQGPDGSGLLVVHSGTQYFKRRDDGSFANLVLREWESHFTGEFGYPRAAAYRYVLRPHAAGLSHTERAQTAAAFDTKPRCVVLAPQAGARPKRQSFVSVEGAQLSALRRPSAESADCELRLFESEGQGSNVRITNIAAPLTATLRPWEIKNLTFKI
ncbi:MAG: hypothetical protein JSS11_00430 [Verrucomicrobia bacterium]|nr:hypothetical protein [Verrucomicrobiota bacterium]